MVVPAPIPSTHWPTVYVGTGLSEIAIVRTTANHATAANPATATMAATRSGATQVAPRDREVDDGRDAAHHAPDDTPDRDEPDGQEGQGGLPQWSGRVERDLVSVIGDDRELVVRGLQRERARRSVGSGDRVQVLPSGVGRDLAAVDRDARLPERPALDDDVGAVGAR